VKCIRWELCKDLYNCYSCLSRTRWHQCRSCFSEWRRPSLFSDWERSRVKQPTGLWDCRDYIMGSCSKYIGPGCPCLRYWTFMQKGSWLQTFHHLRSVAFPATEYDEVLSGCQTSTLRTRTEMVFETLVCSPLKHLTRLIARENLIIFITSWWFCLIHAMSSGMDLVCHCQCGQTPGTPNRL
jgi:hypothetical protein